MLMTSPKFRNLQVGQLFTMGASDVYEKRDERLAGVVGQASTFRVRPADAVEFVTGQALREVQATVAAEAELMAIDEVVFAVVSEVQAERLARRLHKAQLRRGVRQ